jgi:molecular chaperone GrpE
MTQKHKNEIHTNEELHNQTDNNNEIIEPQPKITDEKDDKIKELTELLKRLQAEFENYQKRVESEKSSIRQLASKNLILKFLQIVDNFELAMKHTDNHDELVKGIELIYAQMTQILHGEGLKHVISTGKQFDPNLHEVLLTEESKKKAGYVIEEFQKGYTLNGSVLRHAKVKVAK